MIIRYEVDYWDEILNDQSTDYGLASGKTIGDAVNKVSDYYGEENVCALRVYQCEDVLCDDEILTLDLHSNV